MIFSFAVLAQTAQPHTSALVEVYAKGLRAPLITGFFTLTGASMGIGAFLWAKLKDNVYDKPEYQSRVRAMRAFNPKLSATGPLFRFLYHVVVTSILLLCASIMQATLGFVETKATVIICLSSAALAALSLLLTLFFALRNAIAWHFDSEQHAAANIEHKATVIM